MNVNNDFRRFSSSKDLQEVIFFNKLKNNISHCADKIMVWPM